MGGAGPGRGRSRRAAAAGTPRTTAAGLPGATAAGPCRPAPPADMSARLEQLKQPGELRQAGILTEAEFEQQKARILNG
jgi:Short C-terminal domain